MSGDDRIIEHDSRGFEQGDLLCVGAPRAFVADLALGALLAGELQQAPYTSITGARPDVLHDESHRGAGGLAFEIGRDVTHRCAARLGWPFWRRVGRGYTAAPSAPPRHPIESGAWTSA